MLEKLFKSKTVPGIIKMLILKNSMHIRELARNINITPIYVKKELNNLKDLGIVEESKTGNLSIWHLNKNSPIYNELKQIFLKTDLLAYELTEVIKNFSLDFAFIYGSFASGKERKNSDIDMFLIGQISEDEFIEKLTVIEKKLNREINYILWTKKEFEKRLSKKHYLLEDIIKKPMIWLWGDQYGFERIVGRKVN